MLIACSSTPIVTTQSNATQASYRKSAVYSAVQHAQSLSIAIQKAYQVPAETANRLAPHIIKSAKQANISPYLLAALIQQESSYRRTAVSSAGAIGLTQVMPQFWRNICSGNLYNEQDNIQCGTYILSKYAKLTGDLSKALAYYNVGPTGFEKNYRMRQQGLKYAKSVQRHEQNLVDQLPSNAQSAESNTPVVVMPAQYQITYK